MSVLIVLVVMATLGLGQDCPCYTATKYIQALACIIASEICGPKLATCPVVSAMTTTTVPAVNPTCSATPTVTSRIPCPVDCAQVTCPTVITTKTGDYMCEPTPSAVISTTFSSVSTTRATTNPDIGGVAGMKRECAVSTLRGEQGYITTTSCPHPTHCSRCVECEAPVTVCS